MPEIREIGPGGMIPYGARVRAQDIENYTGPDRAVWLTGLARMIIQAAITAENLSYLVPQVTDRITTPDGGVDASLRIETALPSPRTAGLVNPSKTVYQFKWRSKREAIFPAASGELKKLKDRGMLPDYYVFVTNIDLSGSEKERVKEQLTRDCEEFPADHVVILGAGELADRVNNDPRIRLAHFGVALGICTLESAKDFAERRYGNVGTLLPIYDREEEIAAVRKFLADPGSRVMIVHGPQGVGKTRVLLEALSSIPERVVWAREVPIQPAGLLQALDEAPYTPVLVVDDVEGHSDALLRKALEAARLKTIVVCPWPTGAPGVAQLAISPFGGSDSEKFLGQAFPKMPTGHRGWLFDNFGGMPGVLLQGAVALQASVGPDPLRDPQFEAILQTYEERMIRGLGPATEALTAFSVLPRFRLHLGSTRDLEVICQALGMDLTRVLTNLGVLKARNVIEQAGFREGFYRVTPALLARRIAKGVITGLGDRLITLYQQLSPEGRAGLVRRVAELEDEPAVRGFLGWLFSDTGLFGSVDSVAAGSASVRALTEGIPGPTGRELRRVLESATFEERRDRLTEDDRREVVRALEVLIHRQDTFDDGARGLLCLAEAENEGWANNATGVFTVIFHWRHTEIPKDARLRSRLLSSLAGADSPRKRSLVTKAAAHCLETQFVIHSWQGESVAPPDPGWRATLWAEVHEAIRPVVELLKRLGLDSDREVRREAILGLSRGASGILAVGLREEAIAALEFLATLQLDGSQRARLVEGIAFVVAGLRDVLATAEDGEVQASLRGLIKRGETLFTRLTSADFRSRFLHWLGPAPMRAHRRIKDYAEPSEIVEQGKKLAEEVMAIPSLFEADLLDWVTDEDAHNAGYFLHSLGELDRGLNWLASLEDRLERPRGVSALGIYLAGWFAVAPADAEAYLDAIAGRGGKWSEVAADATWRIGGSPEGVKRLLRCVKEGGVDRASLARQLPWGAWYKPLKTEDVISLVAGVRDGTPAVDLALLEVVHGRWRNTKEDQEQLGPLAEKLLLNSAVEASPMRGHYDWDSLAAALVDWNVDTGFKLLFAHFQKGEAGRGIFFAHHREQLIQALSSRDRPRLVRMFLRAALEGPEAWRVAMELPQILRPETDTLVMLEFANEQGLEAARLVARNLDAAQPGFWEMLPAFIGQWGDDAEVRSGIVHSITWIHGVYSGRAATLAPRLEPLEKLLLDPDPLVRDMAYQAKQVLLREMERGD